MLLDTPSLDETLRVPAVSPGGLQAFWRKLLMLGLFTYKYSFLSTPFPSPFQVSFSGHFAVTFFNCLEELFLPNQNPVSWLVLSVLPLCRPAFGDLSVCRWHVWDIIPWVMEYTLVACNRRLLVCFFATQT